MIDIGTGLGILGSAIGGGKVVEKILGPTSEYIGEQVKEWTKKRVENTANILKNAEMKLGDNINNSGQVPPKVLKSILEDGAWCEEELQIEYFGGVLASSRSTISRDDRGAYFASVISRLSTYQLRTHYIFYKALKELYNGNRVMIAQNHVRQSINVFIPYDSYQKLMDFSDAESINFSELLAHSIWGLNKEDLISNNFRYGSLDFLHADFPKSKEPGIIFQPSKIGVDLMMWAFGYGQNQYVEFFDEKMVFNCGIDSIPLKSYLV